MSVPPLSEENGRAIFLILPEEDATKNFVASLMIQNLARELFSVANEHGGGPAQDLHLFPTETL